MTPDAFKKELALLVERAQTAGAGTRDNLARKTGYGAPTVAKAIGSCHALPTRDVTQALVTVCWRFIDPKLLPDKLQDEVDRWLLRRDEAARQIKSQSRGRDDPLPGPARSEKVATVTRMIADARTAVTAALVRYLELAKRMGEFEKAFDVFYAQTQAGRNELLLLQIQRERLEAAYRRIQPKVRSGELDADGIKADIAAVFESLDLDGDADRGPDPIIGLGPADTLTYALEQRLDDDDDLDVATREQIRRTFRRTVLKAVHPDTSDAELSDFAVALAAYRSDDCILMEAFTIRYQDSIGVDEDGRVRTLAQLTARLQRYQNALQRLETRLVALEHIAASIGMNSLEAAYDRMRREGDRLQMGITAERVRLRELVRALESLIDHPDLNSTSTSRHDGGIDE